jgi:hypothetical protein
MRSHIRPFFRSKAGPGFVTYLCLSAVVSGAIGYGAYALSRDWFVVSKSERRSPRCSSSMPSSRIIRQPQRVLSRAGPAGNLPGAAVDVQQSRDQQQPALAMVSPPVRDRDCAVRRR